MQGRSLFRLLLINYLVYLALVSLGTTFVLIGATLITLALLPANYANLAPLMLLWFVAGAGQKLVNLPTQTLIADRILAGVLGRVYGAHFA